MTQPVRAAIQAIEYYLPEARLTNAVLAQEFPDWPADKIREKLGIDERRIAAQDEYASDLAVEAGLRLFASAAVSAEEIDYLILCTQSPDYFLPSTACLVQARLGLRKTCGALDINLGCSGYVYGLGLAKGLVETGQARHVLLITTDTFSKFVHPRDRSVRTLFGDGAAATYINDTGGGGCLTGPFEYGTDGTGAANMIVPAGGMRQARDPNAPSVMDDNGNERTINDFDMNGAEIFAFALREVPPLIDRVLAAARIALDDVDFFVLHQANASVLAHFQRKLRIPAEKFTIDMADCGNTCSSTIPIALRRAVERSAVRPGMRVMLVGFGVGFSWAAALIQWA